MPFELGLFYSAKHFGAEKQKDKKFLILENERYSVQKYLSDIAGSDANCHKNTEDLLIKELRHWIFTASKRKKIPQATKIQERFNKFMSAINQACINSNTDLYSMPFLELLQCMTEWLDDNRSTHSSLMSGID